MDINNLESLKSHAYDVLVQIEQLQKELGATNQQIAKLNLEHISPSQQIAKQVDNVEEAKVIEKSEPTV